MCSPLDEGNFVLRWSTLDPLCSVNQQGYLLKDVILHKSWVVPSIERLCIHISTPGEGESKFLPYSLAAYHHHSMTLVFFIGCRG